MKLDGNARSPIDGIPTGSLSLTSPCGFGIPAVRAEIFGLNSGKPLTLHVTASSWAVWLPSRRRARPRSSWAGCPASARRPARLPARHRRTGLEICELLVRSNAVDLIVIDSVAALIPVLKSKAKWAIRMSASRPA
jgi:recombination protein RecA